MKTKQLIAAALVFAATTAAFAQTVESNPNAVTKTRAQVMAELQQAQADGTASSYGFLGTTNPAAAAGNAQSQHFVAQEKTRSEVVAELKQAQANGTVIPNSFAAYDVPSVNATNEVQKKTVANK
jgi:hypothetical protein